MRRLRTPALILLIGALLASIGLNVKLFGASVDGYRGELLARLSPLGPTVEIPERRPGLRRIVLIGDSRAAQWPLDIPGAEVVNLGVAGQTSAQIRARASAQLRIAKADVVVIQLGINDLKAIAVLPTIRDRIEAELRTNLGAVVADARSGGAQVVVSTVFPRGRLGLQDRPRWSPEVELAIADFNAYIRSSFPDCFDAAKMLSGHGAAVPAEFAADLLHLNAAGYARLNRELVPRLAKAR